MIFEWDEDKNRRNIERHGVGFALASLVFDGFVLTREDRRTDYGEIRLISIGSIGSA